MIAFGDLAGQARNNPNGIQIWSLGWSANYPDTHDWLTNHFGRGASQNYENYGQNNSAVAIQEGAVQDQLAQADTQSDLRGVFSYINP